MFLKLAIISIVLLVFVLVGLGISILLKPKGKFPEIHIGRNKNMLQRGIRCAQHTDTGCKPVNKNECLNCGSPGINC
jgi:hypothetical protein